MPALVAATQRRPVFGFWTATTVVFAKACGNAQGSALRLRRSAPITSSWRRGSFPSSGAAAELRTPGRRHNSLLLKIAAGYSAMLGETPIGVPIDTASCPQEIAICSSLAPANDDGRSKNVTTGHDGDSVLADRTECIGLGH